MVFPLSSPCLSIEVHIRVNNAQTKVHRVIEANQTVNLPDFCQKSSGYAGIIFLNTKFLCFYSYPNLRALVKHHLPRVTPPESGPSSSELDDEETSMHYLLGEGSE